MLDDQFALSSPYSVLRASYQLRLCYCPAIAQCEPSPCDSFQARWSSGLQGAHTCWFSQIVGRDSDLQELKDETGRSNSPLPSLLSLEQTIAQRKADSDSSSGRHPNFCFKSESWCLEWYRYSVPAAAQITCALLSLPDMWVSTADC